MKQFKFEIIWRNPKDLIPYVKNAKKHSSEQVDRIAGQIAAFGFDQPIVVDGNNVLIKGHGRREAAIKLGLQEVPVIVSDLDEYEAMAARIADNKVVSNEYDTDKLKFDLGTIKNKGLDLKLTGMTAIELKPLVLSDSVNKQIAPPAEKDEYQESESNTGGEDNSSALEPGSDVDEEGEPKSEGFFMDRNPVIQYNIIFDDKTQQEKWHSFVTHLKEKYPEMETISARIIRFIEESVK